MKIGLAIIFFLSTIVLYASCSSNTTRKHTEEATSVNTSDKKDTPSYTNKHYKPTKDELKAMQREEAREEAEEEYYSTDGDQADNPDFDDDIPGDEHDEEFIGNEGDPELYNE